MTALAVGAGSALLARSAFPNVIPEPFSTFDPFSTITLGKTGIRTTFLGLGTGYNGYNRSSSITRAGTAESVIRAAFDRGIRYFDCADTYGTHPYLKAALKGIARDSYTIGTKMWITRGGIPDSDKGFPETVVDRLRKELDSDYIDIVQLHCLTEADWPEKYQRYMAELEDLKSRKVIRAHGVSIHSYEALQAAADSPWVDVAHVRINPFGDNMDKKDPSLIVPLIRKLHETGKGVIGMKLIGGGTLVDDSEKIDESLRFVLALGTIDLIIAGFESPEQIDNYIGRIRKVVKP